MRRTAIIALALAFTAPSFVLAGPLAGGALDSDDAAWFYNRPGATLEQVGADQAECRSFGGRMMGSTTPFQDRQYGLVGMIVGDIAAAGPTVAYADDCMMSKGYRRYNLPGMRMTTFMEQLRRLPLPTQRLYAGGETPPEGTLARVWVNDYWLGDEGASLRNSRSVTPVAPPVETFNSLGRPHRIRATEGAPSAPSGDNALVLVTVHGPTGRAMANFELMNPVSGLGVRVPVGGRERWPSFEASTDNDQRTAQLAFVIPAGVYALSQARTGRYDFTDFCLGTIAFEARAGEVIDLGEITVVRGDAVVDPQSPPPETRLRIVQPSIDAARAQVLGAAALADRLQAASYRNGFPRQCRLFGRIYGVDMPGAADWIPGEADK